MQPSKTVAMLPMIANKNIRLTNLSNIIRHLVDPIPLLPLFYLLLDTFTDLDSVLPVPSDDVKSFINSVAVLGITVDKVDRPLQLRHLLPRQLVPTLGHLQGSFQPLQHSVVHLRTWQ